MTGEELNRVYGAMISPEARVSVPENWMPAVHTAMEALCDLPTSVRAYLIVIAILKDADGDLAFHVAGATAFVGEDGMQLVADIIGQAQDAVARLEVLH